MTAADGLTIVTFGVTPTSTVVALTEGDGLTTVTFGDTPTSTVVALTAGDGLTRVTLELHLQEPLLH